MTIYDIIQKKAGNSMNENIEVTRNLLNSIYKSCWVEIKYHNKQDITKSFWIAIKDINFESKTLLCDSISLDENKHTIKEINISIDRILSTFILENTYYDDNNIKTKLEKNFEKTKEIFSSYEFENVLLYLQDCVKADVIPYKTDIEIAWGIDKNIFKDKNEYFLSPEQTKQLKKFMSIKKDKTTSYKQLAINLLSIVFSSTKEYVIAHMPIRWNLNKNSLIKISNEPIFNPRFKADINSSHEYQINEYLTEDQQELLKNFDENYDEIYKILSSKINKNKAFLNDTPELLIIEKNKLIEIEKEFDGIRYMYQTNKVTKPISAFFGELELSKTKFKEKGLCFVNDNLNLSQLSSIFAAFKDEVTFVQGPPGTGKTSTVINTVTTAFYNKMKVLLVTNNNKPMKDIKRKLDNLGNYKNEKIELPVLRLSAKDKMTDTIKSMHHLYIKYKGAKVNDAILDKNSNFQQDNLKEIINQMNEVDNYLDIIRKNKDIDNFLEFMNSTDSPVQLSIRLQTKKNQNVKMLNPTDVNKIINQAEHIIRSFLYFYSAKCLQNLDKPTYAELKNIIDINIQDNAKLDESVEKLIGFLNDANNVKLLLDVFPIILSTNLSANKLANPQPYFDICIMDEAAQCNLATSLIPIIRAKKIMLVGDVQQLKPVIILNDILNETLKQKYGIKNNFCYMSNSIYSTLKENAPTQKENLLNEHYRCNKMIVDFCNRKYYRNKLIIASKDNNDSPLEFINIENEVNDDEKNISLNEIKEVIKILQRKDLKGKSIGIITPYVVQKNRLEKEVRNQIKNIDFDIGTIHTFQGDEKDVIIFSSALTNKTTHGTYNWLKSNKQLINVAVSRAISKLILLCNEDALIKLHNSTSNNKIDDFYELYEHITTEGKCTITPNSIKCEALESEEFGTLKDKNMYSKISLSLSTLTSKTKYKERIKYTDILEAVPIDGKFDFVIYDDDKNISLAVQIVKLSQKNEYFEPLKTACANKNIELLLVNSNEIRSYYAIKDLLKEELKKKR